MRLRSRDCTKVALRFGSDALTRLVMVTPGRFALFTLLLCNCRGQTPMDTRAAEVVSVNARSSNVLVEASPPPTPAASASATPSPDPLPDFTFRTFTGDKVRSLDLRGSPVIIFVWATSCVPCAPAREALARLSAKLAPRGVYFIAVSEDITRTKWLAYFEIGGKSHGGSPYMETWDENHTIREALAVNGMPSVLLVDKRSAVRWRSPWTSATEGAVEAEAEALLGEP
jgi:thiol-disulfide isomerase/thioredoxin